jgi:GT2 family glycosyltransferase
MTVPELSVPVLSVVLVNYRTPVYVIECLATLLPELAGLDARVVIVDNCSGDGSAEDIAGWLQAYDPAGQVILVRSPSNAGFGGGNNTGIRVLKAEHYLLLNSDTLIRPGAIAALLETAKAFPEAGLVSPRLEWPDGTAQESCFLFHTPISEMIGAAQTGVIERIFGRYVVPMPVQTELAWPKWTSFACVLVRVEVFQKIGLLDDGYFMYFEDVEFCLRARRAGWQIVHNPRASVVHLRGGSSPVKERTRLKRRLPRYFYESRARFFYQAYGWWGLTAANLFWWGGRCVSKVRQLLGRSDKSAVERQWSDIWTNWLHPMKPYARPKS